MDFEIYDIEEHSLNTRAEDEGRGHKTTKAMKDRLDEVVFYLLAKELWLEYWDDCESLDKDVRGKEIIKQLTRSVGSISANIEEGYGRGFGKEYPLFLRYSRGSARETKGWYQRSGKLLPDDTLKKRIEKLDSIIAMETTAIKTLENKNKKP